MPDPSRTNPRLLLLPFGWKTLPFWLPTARSVFDGASYEWNLFGFGGTGQTFARLVAIPAADA